MSSIDRAFIKAFGQDEANPAPAGPEPAGPASPAAQETDRTSLPSADGANQAPAADSAEETAPACSSNTEGVCTCPADGMCGCSVWAMSTLEQAQSEEGVSPLPPAVEPATDAPAEDAAVDESGAAAADPAEASPDAEETTGVEEKAFLPAFQVDSFAWPSGCARLGMVARDQMEQLAAALIAGQAEGQQVVAMSGCRRGDGCTTLLLCVARRLAERGLQVALVDADIDNPLLARRLGLLPDVGWEEVLTARADVSEVIIESVQDRLAVLPLCGTLPCRGCPAPQAPDPLSRLNALREHYDLVLVDLGEFGEGTTDGEASSVILNWIDAVVLVRDVRTTRQAELNRIRRRVETAGLVEAGIAENFVELRKSA
jgi:Mrp family chromosome partitioning ATPase